MKRIKSRDQILRMARYITNAIDDGDNRREAGDRAKRLEQAGRLREDGSLVPVHKDETTIPQ